MKVNIFKKPQKCPECGHLNFEEFIEKDNYFIVYCRLCNKRIKVPNNYRYLFE